jgi:phenylacetaldehyde dehydrogenase
MAVVEGLAKTALVQELLSSPHQMLINGEWVDSASGKTFTTYNPSTGEELGQVAEGSEEDVNRAVAAARAAFDHGPWKETTPSERSRLLWKLADLLEENVQAFAELETLDNGKSVTISETVDMGLAIEHIRYMAGWATKLDGKHLNLSIPDTHAYTRREPIGVCGQIIPWNFPMLMAAWKIAPAMAAGCTVVLKPAEQTPLTALLFGKMIQEAGFPPGVVNIVTGFGEATGAPLAAHPDVDKVAFTGSTEVGKMILTASAGNLKKVTLELGGKSPNVIFADANLEAATGGAANGIFFNHGQTCCAGSRVYIEKKSFDNVVGDMANIANNIKLAPGMDDSCEMGPLISTEQLERVSGMVDGGIKAGATAACGGEVVSGNGGYFYKPTILVDTKPDMDVVVNEIFGPVVTAIPFETTEDIITEANNSVYGLAAGVWTSDISKAHKAAAALRAGTVWVNCYNLFDNHMPFGGYKQSGIGREMGVEAIENYLQTKSVCVQL